MDFPAWDVVPTTIIDFTDQPLIYRLHTPSHYPNLAMSEAKKLMNAREKSKNQAQGPKFRSISQASLALGTIALPHSLHSPLGSLADPDSR